MVDLSAPILSALDAGGAWVSSARLVAAHGVSRVAISKHVRRLRRLGYTIESAPRRGYRLLGRTARAVPEEVTPLMTSCLVGRPYRFFPEIDSTNSFLQRHTTAFPEGTAVGADAQHHGRGRYRRDWYSPPGANVYLSVLLKPAVPPHLAPQLSFLGAAAVLRELHAAGCPEARFKWPNDILWRGRKLAGVLCELTAEADVIHAVVIGMGVNVNLMEFPADLRRSAASLRMALGRPVSVPSFVADVLSRLDLEYARWRRQGPAGLVRFLNRYSMLTGHEVTMALSREKIRGRVARIVDTGALRVVPRDGAVREITSGEVHLCRSAAASGRGREDA